MNSWSGLIAGVTITFYCSSRIIYETCCRCVQWRPDSTTRLVQALQQYDEVHCVTFDYGQRHRAEIDVARELALKLGHARIRCLM